MSLDMIVALADRWRSEPLSPEISHHATRAVLDWWAATVAGSVMAPATLLVDALGEDVDRGRARLIPSGRNATTRTAALINATAAHTAEVDDIFRDGIYHPGCPTIGAALACAELADASGEQFLRAVAVGYEVGTRIAAAINPGHYRFWHTTGTVGSLGAAVAASVALGASREQLGHAVATATTFAAGLQQAFRSEAMSKPLHAGHAADVGVLAALGAVHGVTGAADVIEGEAGFLQAMGDGADLVAAFADPTMGNIARMTFKAHAACGHTFAAIDAAAALAEQHGLAADDVVAVRVGTYATALKVAGITSPATPFEAKFSIPYCVAAVLVFGNVQLAATSPQAMADPGVRRLVPLVSLDVDAELDAGFPGRRGARVAIDLADGTTVERLAPTRRGDPDSPLSDADLEAKFAGLVDPVSGPEEARRTAAAIWGLPAMASVATLTSPEVEA